MIPHSGLGRVLQGIRIWCNISLLLIPMLGVVFVLGALTPPPHPQPKPGVTPPLVFGKQEPEPLNADNYLYLTIVLVAVPALMLVSVYFRSQQVYAIALFNTELEVAIQFPEHRENIFRAYRDAYERFKQEPQFYAE